MVQEPTVRVYLPHPLREYAKGEDAVEVPGATLAEVVSGLNAKFPGLGYRLLDDQGRMRRYILVFVNDDSVAHLAPESVSLKEGDEVRIVPSVAGG